MYYAYYILATYTRLAWIRCVPDKLGGLRLETTVCRIHQANLAAYELVMRAMERLEFAACR